LGWQTTRGGRNHCETKPEPIMRLAALFTLLTLAACGADGPPVAPTSAEPGPAITGQVKVGISG